MSKLHYLVQFNTRFALFGATFVEKTSRDVLYTGMEFAHNNYDGKTPIIR